MISDAFDPALLRTFVSVCRNESLSRAAEQAGRAQSALSMQMRRLEAIVGKRLLHRTGRGVTPTLEGELFLSYANRVLALAEDAAARLAADEVSGAVRVGLGDDIAITTLPAALGRLRRSYPRLQLEVIVDHAETVARRWNDGELDIAVAECGQFDTTPLDSWSVDLHWVCAIDDTPDPGRPLDLVVFADPCEWRRRMLQSLANAGRDFRIAFTCHNIGTIAAAVEHGIGASLLPSDAIRSTTMRIMDLTGQPSMHLRYGLFARRSEQASLLAATELIHGSLQHVVPARRAGAD